MSGSADNALDCSTLSLPDTIFLRWLCALRALAPCRTAPPLGPVLHPLRCSGQMILATLCQPTPDKVPRREDFGEASSNPYR